jgi:prephenate dehydrogenase
LFAGVGIVGVGLLGGSIGLALKLRGLCPRVVGVAPKFPRAETDLDAALRRGAIDERAIEFDSTLGSLELVVVCTPVDRIANDVVSVCSHLGPEAVVTDVGSTKAELVREISARLPRERRFVGSHPLAGSEKSGPEAASAFLFDGRTCVVTPSESAAPEVVERVSAFWRALGMTVLYKTPEEHDRIVSRTSHLPHLAAAVLASLVKESDRPFAGNGLRDATRIAAGGPDLWTAIFRHNRAALLDALAGFESSLASVHNALEREDYAFLNQWLTKAKRDLDAMGS